MVVVVVISVVVMVVVVVMVTFMTVCALMEEEGEDAEKAKLGVCVNSHRLFTATPLQRQQIQETRFFIFKCLHVT